MSLFRDLGKRVERFKQQAEETARDNATHECAACGERFHTVRKECSECGSEEIRELD